jgi:hypothetical protein
MSEEITESNFYDYIEKYSFGAIIKNNRLKENKEFSTLMFDFASVTFKNKEIFLKIREIPKGNKFVLGIANKTYFKFLNAMIESEKTGVLPDFPKYKNLKAYMYDSLKKQKVFFLSEGEMDFAKPVTIKVEETESNHVIGIKIDEEKKEVDIFQNEKKIPLFKNIELDDPLFVFVFFDNTLKAELVETPNYAKYVEVEE